MARWRIRFLTLSVCVLVASCGGGKSANESGFRLLQFLEDGQDNIPRNRVLTFSFSGPVHETQDFPERLKIQNVQTGATSNFARAIGGYVIDADRVTFAPRLPQMPDRSDAGFKAFGDYTVFIKAGPDALLSTDGSRVARQQEFIFNTNEFFDDPVPTDPPRAVEFLAKDTVTGGAVDLSRLDPRASEVALMDSKTLIDAMRVIEPGAGPDRDGAWHLELRITEPLDPSGVTTDNVRMTEVYSNATTSADDEDPDAPMDHFGTPVNHPVPITVDIVQGLNASGVVEVNIRVTPLAILVDDTRYRVTFSGNILGLDFRKTFIGENGLTGDGETVLSGAGVPFEEPGGLGYTLDFIVRDRPSITAERVLEYDPLVDGIEPEQGQTTVNESIFNGALYNPPGFPSQAVGFIGAFGGGTDGDFAVGSGIRLLDTGDTLNAPLETPFDVVDLDPTDTYKNTAGLPPPGIITWDTVEATVFDFASVTISAGGTMQVIGVNPCQIKCTGLFQCSGTIDASGGDGGPGSQANGGNSKTSPGLAGVGGPGGYPGGQAESPLSSQSTNTSFSCSSFETYLNASGVQKSQFPWSTKGEGPGRGNQGGDFYTLGQAQSHTVNTSGNSGSGGGGGSHGRVGERGEDNFNANGSAGSPGQCGQWGVPNSSLIGLRGMPGPTYGDREVFDIRNGGSGGGAGGGGHGWYNSGGGVASGGGGGGGGGFVEVLCAGPIIVSGVIDVSGGDGGKGGFNIQQNGSWTRVAGSGGAGSGGTVSLVSVTSLNLTGGLLNAAGGTGGPPPNSPPSINSCSGCNGGGDGGDGYIFIMDPDGVADGFAPIPQPGDDLVNGEYNSHPWGVLTVKSFDANRFGGITAVTELYHVRVANPKFLGMEEDHILANVLAGQTISVLVSSARPDPENPLAPDLGLEIPAYEAAFVSFDAGSTDVDVTGDLFGLNPDGDPMRDAFMRVQSVFTYGDPVQAAVGPYITIDRVIARFTFN